MIWKINLDKKLHFFVKFEKFQFTNISNVVPGFCFVIISLSSLDLLNFTQWLHSTQNGTIT